MNNRSYKLVFDKKRGMLVAVSEITNADGKGVGEGTITTTDTGSEERSVFSYAFKLSPLELAAKFMLGTALIVGGSATAQIINDPNQSGSKPVIGVAGNGVPIINIVAPNNSGVSLNQFQQYNVNSNGAILNNSGGMSQTQLAGMVQGNPYLGNNSARTIINQVTGPYGSNLNGYQEIAGQKANLVIANPNGISVNGGGFINTANVTLTTGTPQLTNGTLTGFNITGGNIAVNGEGLNATGADKLTIMSRAAQINAQVWANQADVILGANQVAVDNDSNTGAINAQQGTGAAPQFALDVSALGSMYAGHMRIVGTEAGFGINNGGKLISEGALTLDANGNLSNSGQINGSNDSSIKATGLTNSGELTAVNNLTIKTGAVTNSGNITAGSVQLDGQSLNNTGRISQSGAQKLDINANTLNNTGRIGIADQPVAPDEPAPTTSTNTTAPATQTATNIPDVTPTTTVATNPVVLNNGQIIVSGDITNSGIIDAGGDVNVNVNTLNNQAGKLQTAGNLTVNAPTVNNQGGTIKSQTQAAINSTVVNNQNAGLIQAPNLTINANTIDNSNSGTTGGLIGEKNLTLNANGTINNNSGYIAGGQLALNTPNLTNKQGTIVTSGDLTLGSNTLDNAEGNISAKNLTLNNQTINNQQGSLNAVNQVKVNATTINNQGGELTGGKKLEITAQNINNQDAGLLQAEDVQITAAQINNRNSGDTGGILGTTILNLTTNQTLDNTAGYIAGGQASLNGNSLINTSGTVLSNTLTLNTADINNASGNITAYDSATINGTTLNNQAGIIQAGTTIALNVDSIDNKNTKQDLTSLQAKNTPLGIQAKTVKITGTNIDNSNGQILGTDIATQGQTLNNQSGQIIGNNVATQATNQIDNSDGQLIANKTLTIETPNLINTNGKAHANETLNLTIHGNYTASGQISSANSLNLKVDQDFTNVSGNTLSAAGKLAINANNILNQTNATIAAGHTALTATNTITNDGLIDGNLVELRANTLINNNKIYGGTPEGEGGIVLGVDTFNNKENAVIASRGNMAIGARIVNNEPGAIIQSLGDLGIGGKLESDYTLTGQAQQVNNKSATIEVGKNITQWDVAQTLNQNTNFSSSAGTPTTADGSYNLVGGQEYKDGDVRFVVFPFKNPSLQGATNSAGNTPRVIGNGSDVANTFEIGTADPSTGFTILANKYIVLPSEQYPFDAFGPNIGYSNLNFQSETYNTELTKPTQCGGSTCDINYYSSIFVAVDGVAGNNTSTPIGGGNDDDSTNEWGSIRGQYSGSEYQDKLIAQYGWRHYNFGQMTLGLSSNQSDKRYQEYITFAYYPGRTYHALADVGPSNDSYERIMPKRHFIESFTYTKNDAIWSKFGVTPPATSPAPYPGEPPKLPMTSGGGDDASPITIRCDLNPSQSACSAYNTQKATYDANLSVYSNWADQNRDKYIELNRKILAFNDDVVNRTVKDYTRFSGTATTTSPVVNSSAPAKIIVGGNMNLSSGHITNDKSQIIVGGVLSGNVDGITNDNTGATGQETTTYSGTMIQVKDGRADNTQAANPAPVIRTVNLSVAEFRQNAGTQALNGQAGQQGANPGNQAAGTAADLIDSPIDAVPTTDGKEVRSVAFNGILPSNVMFTQHGDPNADYLIETDPTFTNKKAFLSSDYMLAQLAADPDRAWKRIGDGFYEQKLINDQIITATGKRFVGDYSSNEEQYKALMNNGLAFGKAFGLSVGTALSAEQMKNLTTDIVWMVKETIILADGTKQTVLVPKVYLAVNTLDLKGDGTLIAAKHNWLDVKGDLNNNGGTFAGTSSMDVTAANINNRGGTIGGNQGGIVQLRATDTLNNIGGSIRGGTVALAADTVNITTTTQTTTTGNMANQSKRGYASTRTAIDQVGSVSALDADQGNIPALTIQATKDLNLTAASLNSAGSAVLVAENINSKTVDTGFEENIVWKAKNRLSRSDQAEVGSVIQTEGDLTAIADNSINLRATTVAANGDAILMADTVNIEAGRQTHDSYEEEYKKKSGFLSKKTSHKIDTGHSDTSIGSQIIGDTVTILSEGDTTISGSTVFGTHGVDIASAHGNVNIEAATDNYGETHYNKVTKSGFGALGGFSFGKMSSEQGMSGDQIGHTGSTVASLLGDVNISAKEGTASIKGSTVDSALGNVNVNARNIAITDVHNTVTEDTYSKFKSTGLTVSISSPLIDAANMGQTLADQAGNASGGTQIGAVAASSAMAGYVAYRGIKDMANSIGSLSSASSVSDIVGAVGSISISLGTQKSESKSHSEQTSSQGSSVTAGGKVNLTATGAGKADDGLTADNASNQGSDIFIQNGTVAGKGGTHLKADDDIIANAGTNTNSLSSSNKSSGGSVGVSLGANGFSVNLAVNMAKGKAKGNGVDYSESIIGDASSQTTFESGDDTVLNGAAIVGQQVTGKVGGDLTITTLQDKSQYDSKQTSMSAGVSIPIGAGAITGSISASNDKIKANHQTANELSGIYAGDGGFNVTVDGKTELTGAVIASSATPDKNHLTTGTLITRDLENQSDYKATSVGGSLSYSTTNTATGKQGGYHGFNAGLPAVMSAKDSDSSTTHSGISAGTVTITDEAAQQAATGKSAAQTLAELNRDVSLESQTATGLDNLYERDKEKIENGFAIVKTLTENSQKFMALMARDIDQAASQPAVDKDGKPIMVDGKQLTNKEAYDKGYTLGDSPVYQTGTDGELIKDANGNLIPTGQTVNYATRQNLWGSGGTGSMILTGLVGAASGNVTGGTSALIQNTAINVIRQYGAQEIKAIADSLAEKRNPDGSIIPDATSESIRAALHAIAGCAGAAATGGDCTSAAAASAATVALNNLISHDPKDMTEEQKQAYSNLIGTLVAGTTVGLGGDAAAAALASKIEVDNNDTSNPLYEELGEDGKKLADKLWETRASCKSNPNEPCMANPALVTMGLGAAPLVVQASVAGGVGWNVFVNKEYKFSDLTYDATAGALIDKATGAIVKVANPMVDKLPERFFKANSFVGNASLGSLVTPSISERYGKRDLVIVPKLDIFKR